MTTEKLPRARKCKLVKIRSIRFRFLTTVIFAMFAITIFVGGISIYEVDSYVQKQSEAFVSVTCANAGERINNNLKNMEKSVIIMESYLMDFFKSVSDVEDAELQKTVVESAEKMFTDVAKHTTTAGAVSYYFRFDPEISDSKAGLFYSKINGGSEFVSLEPTDLSLYDKNDVEHVGWFWQPYEAKQPIWMEPYHNQNNDILMISYVIPMYFDEKFIGVVGMDFDYKSLANTVSEIEIYENGFACLELDGAIISDDKSDIKSDIDPQKYMRVSETLTNGMTLVLFASYDDIRQTRYDITKLHLNEGLTKIETTAIWDMDYLTYVNIPSTVVDIGWSNFGNCPKLLYLIAPKTIKKTTHQSLVASGSVVLVEYESLPSTWDSTTFGYDKRLCEEIKEKRGFVMNPRFGTSVHNRFTDAA